MTSLRRASTILSIAVSASLFCGAAAFGQSLRRSPVKLGSPKQEGVSRTVEREIDQRYGRAVWVDDGRVGVITQPHSVFKDWGAFYYACDSRLNPVAVLMSTGISHRNCRIFQVTEGSVERNDWVFIKQIPPFNEKAEAAEDASKNS